MRKLVAWMTRRMGISETAAIMLLAIAGLYLLLAAVGLLAIGFGFRFEQPRAYLLGLLAGCALSAAKVALLERALDKTLGLGGKAAQGYAGLQAMLRYVLTIAVLLCVMVFPQVIGPVGAVSGLLALQMSAYVAGYALRGPTQEDLCARKRGG